MKNKNGVSFGLLSGIFWGLGLTISAYIFSIFTDLSPFVVAAAHDFLSIFILLAFLLVKEGKVRLSIFLNIRNVSVIIGALLAGPIGMQANLYAVKYIGSSLASSVSAIYPAISVLLAFFFLKHKISKNTVFGIILIIAGIIAQTYKVEQVNSFYIGILCALVCAIAWGSESVLSSFAMESELSEIEALLIRQVTSFLSHYESEQTPVSREKIAIYKILQDAIWSLWTVYKEEQGADFGDYGVNRYQRAVKGLSYYGGSDEK